jgi:hypothetical protein
MVETTAATVVMTSATRRQFSARPSASICPPTVTTA